MFVNFNKGRFRSLGVFAAREARTMIGKDDYVAVGFANEDGAERALEKLKMMASKWRTSTIVGIERTNGRGS